MPERNNNIRTIETDNLTIKGNIMTWEGTMIQLSNVSSISRHPLPEKPFPIFSLLFIIAALILVLMEYNPLIIITVAACGCLWIYGWYKENEEIRKRTYLSIIMNSGTTLGILFNDQDFLKKVLDVLEQVMLEGGVGKSNICVDIKDCHFSGDANILDNFNIR